MFAFVSLRRARYQLVSSLSIRRGFRLGISVENRFLEIAGLDSESGLIISHFTRKDQWDFQVFSAGLIPTTSRPVFSPFSSFGLSLGPRVVFRRLRWKAWFGHTHWGSKGRPLGPWYGTGPGPRSTSPASQKRPLRVTLTRR